MNLTAILAAFLSIKRLKQMAAHLTSMASLLLSLA